MQAFSFSLGNQTFEADLLNPFSLAIPFKHKEGPVAYSMDKPLFTPFESGDFKASIAEGGSLNCFLLSFYPHGNGTHTESMLHVDPAGLPMNKIKIKPFLSACLVSLEPSFDPISGDSIISDAPSWVFDKPFEAIIIRTLPNDESKLITDYSGTNPPYFSDSLFERFAQHGIFHVLTDLPSVDKEVDEGRLAAHKAFFAKRKEASITEMIYVPQNVTDGVYLLNLQYPMIETDAVPSHPVIFACKEI